MADSSERYHGRCTTPSDKCTRARSSHLIFLAAVIGTLLVFSGCRRSRDPQVVRSEIVESSQTIKVGIVWPKTAGDLLVEGALLAIEQVNEMGGFHGKKVVPIVVDEKNRFDATMRNVKELSRQPDLFAVIGHSDDSNASEASSIIYEEKGILMLSPGTSSRQFVSRGFRRIFQTIPDDYEVGSMLIKGCVSQHFKKVALVYERISDGRAKGYGENLAQAFLAESGVRGIEVDVQRSFFAGQTDFIDIVAQIKEARVDVVVLASLWPSAAQFIQRARQMQLDVPVLGGDRLESPYFAAEAGESAEGTIVVSEGIPIDDSPEGRMFRESFYRRWNVRPTMSARQAYDTVRLLQFAVTQGDSLNSDVVASLIRHTKNWQGISGTYFFTDRGDIEGLPLSLKRIEGGRFVPLELEESLLPVTPSAVPAAESGLIDDRKSSLRPSPTTPTDQGKRFDHSTNDVAAVPALPTVSNTPFVAVPTLNPTPTPTPVPTEVPTNSPTPIPNTPIPTATSTTKVSYRDESGKVRRPSAKAPLSRPSFRKE